MRQAVTRSTWGKERGSKAGELCIRRAESAARCESSVLQVQERQDLRTQDIARPRNKLDLW